MFCPSCRSEFQEGVAHCDNCEVDLVDMVPAVDPYASPEAMAKLLEGADLRAVVAGAFASVMEAQRILADARIASVIAPEVEGTEIGPGVHQRLFLMVSEADVARVRDHFEGRWNAGLEAEGLTWQAPAGTERDDGKLPCPACGAAIAEADSECPDCGLVV
jgi:hypothetical protein